MQEWIIEYLADDSGRSPVEKWLDKLTEEKLKCVTKELRLLELCGNELKLPHSKSLGGGLFELRERKFGYRIYYTFKGNKIIILLEVGDKASQKGDIKKARQRLARLIKIKVK